jgi:DUF1365 family protein
MVNRNGVGLLRGTFSHRHVYAIPAKRTEEEENSPESKKLH